MPCEAPVMMTVLSVICFLHGPDGPRGVIWRRRDFPIRWKYLECLLHICKSRGWPISMTSPSLSGLRSSGVSRAARALGMPVSTVSRKVTALEQRLGVTLLQRTTRKLSLTAQGRAYCDQCSEPLSQLFDAEQVLTQTQRKPEGFLRISAPVILGQTRSMPSCPHS